MGSDFTQKASNRKCKSRVFPHEIGLEVKKKHEMKALMGQGKSLGWGGAGVENSVHLSTVE